MKTVEIALDQLALETPNFRNPRSAVGDIPDLALSIASRGLLYPLLVAKDGDVYAIIEGGRRFRALTYLANAAARLTELPAWEPVGNEKEPSAKTQPEQREHWFCKQICELNYFGGKKPSAACILHAVDNDGRSLVEALVGNVARNALSSAEIGRALHELIEERNVLNGKQAAAALGKSMAWVSRAKNGWQALSEAGQSRWLQGHLTDADVESVQSLKTSAHRKRHEKEVCKARDAEQRAIGDGKDERTSASVANAAIKTSYERLRQQSGKGKGGAGKAGTSPATSAEQTPRGTTLALKEQHRIYDDLVLLPEPADYVQGVRDGIAVALGILGEYDLAEEYTEALATAATMREALVAAAIRDKVTDALGDAEARAASRPKAKGGKRRQRSAKRTGAAARAAA